MTLMSRAQLGFILLVAAASLLEGSEAKTIVVGGSEGWRFGFNYTDWALQNSPFYINDELGEYHSVNCLKLFYLIYGNEEI
jgi:hypothetical protein